jgi:hypothetical protein
MKDKELNRSEAIQNLIASIAVMTWSMDLEMSAAILSDTSDRFGDFEVAKLMEEILQVLNGGATTNKDLIKHAAALTFVRPMPLNWSTTIH